MATDAGITFLTSLLLAVPLSAAAQAEHRFEIRGRVVDTAGRPVANIAVATHWSFDAGRATPRWRSAAAAKNNACLRTDADGRFAGTIYARRPTVALMALDIENKRGGIAIFSKDRAEEECKLAIGPLVRVHGKTLVDDERLRANTRYIYVTDPRARIAIASSISTSPAFSILMPPGEYEFSFSAKDVERVSMAVSVQRDGSGLDLGKISLSPTNLARHYGKAPPAWTITAARGVGKDVKLADYKGRWVLIEFWAYW